MRAVFLSRNGFLFAAFFVSCEEAPTDNGKVPARVNIDSPCRARPKRSAYTISRPRSQTLNALSPHTTSGRLSSQGCQLESSAPPSGTERPYRPRSAPGVSVPAEFVRKGKKGVYAINRVAAGAHFPTPCLFESAKRPDDRVDYCLGCSFRP